MKKHHFILSSCLCFIFLFYNEDLGLNLGLYGLFLIGLIVYFFKEKIITKTNRLLVLTSVLSCCAFAYFGDLISFVALFLSIVLLQFNSHHPSLKPIQIVPLIVINSLTSSVRILMLQDWLPQSKINANFAKKLLAYVLIPMAFVSLFFLVYSFGSDHFSSLYSDYTLDINWYQLLFVVVLGFYFSFSFWNYWVPQAVYDFNTKLNSDFNIPELLENPKDFSSIGTDFFRKSGEITLILLNLLLILFILTYNYEQFFQQVDTQQLSTATHERVNAVIFSILMSIALILFYFKGTFNFDAKAKTMKTLAKVWILLNAVLILSTFLKNAEYVSFFGLTYKRLGVFAFLLIALISLIFTFKKIKWQKTNAYLFTNMFWYCYGLILVCSFLNWGNLITCYNISVNKGVEPMFLSRLNFNDAARRKFFLENKLDGEYFEAMREEEIKNHQKSSFLSKTLYYEFLE